MKNCKNCYTRKNATGNFAAKKLFCSLCKSNNYSEYTDSEQNYKEYIKSVEQKMLKLSNAHSWNEKVEILLDNGSNEEEHNA